MPSTETSSDVAALAARRRLAADPLLPPDGPAAPDCETALIVGGPDGPAAVGRCQHWAGEAGSLDLTWGAARRFQLSAAVAGPGVTHSLDQLLSRWRHHLATVPGAGDADTAAVVNWPSRDTEGIAALLRHGLAPLEVLAARTVPRRPPAGTRSEVPNGGGLTADGPFLVRRAGPADEEVVARLGLEVVRWDARFGYITERPSTLPALRREAAEVVAGPEPWTWLAERDGEPVGMLAAQRPEAAGWIAPMTGLAPAAYLMLTFVQPGLRGGGVGRLLADEFHRTADAAGAAVTLLHYEQLNPLSAPFWSRQGYRPLWTTWQASPASSLR
jgi:GNAT superfamily N-acetyltransferase